MRTVLSPQPDENASPAHLSPIQSYHCDMNIGVPATPTSGVVILFFVIRRGFVMFTSAAFK